MIHRIEVGFKDDVTDAAGESVRGRILEHLGIHVEGVQTVEVYTIDADIAAEQADFLRMVSRVLILFILSILSVLTQLWNETSPG